MARSLRRQLLAWVLVPLALLAAFNARDSWVEARDAANLVTDRTLAASARSIVEQVQVEDDQIQVLVPPAALEMFDIGAGDFVYYAVRDGEGRLLAGSADLPQWRRDGTTGRPASIEAGYRDRPLRLLALDHPLVGPRLKASVTAVVGVTLGGRDSLLRRLWLAGFGQQLALIVTAGLFMAYGLKRSLAPLLGLRDTVLLRPGNSLQPLDTGAVQAELQPLVVAINQQMARVEKQLAAQHRFVTNAAHQLRTPLTLLNVQATFALRHRGLPEEGAALSAIQASTTQLSRLAGQLLTLSRAEPGSRRERNDTIDLGALARHVLKGFAEPALAKGVDLGFEERKAALVQGDATMLGEMLVNLVDNAIRYCPPRSTVTVIVDRRKDVALLIVQDDGLGLPEGEHERVFERFYRVLGTGGDGSGLGLAIVREVAETAGGSVSAIEMAGGGLSIEVRLKMVAQPGP